MATVKTVGTGKDYTTLASWWTFAAGEASADQHAACYGGSDLAEVTMSGATATPSASLYFKVYAASGERHDGRATGTGAYIDVNSSNGISIQENYTRIEGMRFNANALHNGIYIPDAENCRIEKCCFIAEGATGFLNCIGTRYINKSTSVDIWNNVIYGLTKGGGGGVGLYGGIQINTLNSSGTNTLTATIYNNVIQDIATTTGGKGYGIVLDEVTISGTGILNATVTNNVVTESAMGDYYDTVANGTITGSYNDAGDTTATPWGATGSNNNIVDDDTYVDPEDDLRLLTSATSYDSGTAIGDFTDDCQDQSRPLGGSWDKGAFENAPPATPLNTIII